LPSGGFLSPLAEPAYRNGRRWRCCTRILGSYQKRPPSNRGSGRRSSRLSRRASISIPSIWISGCDDRSERLLTRFLRQKYQGRKVDLVILIAFPTLHFFLQHRDELFPGVPANDRLRFEVLLSELSAVFSGLPALEID